MTDVALCLLHICTLPTLHLNLLCTESANAYDNSAFIIKIASHLPPHTATGNDRVLWKPRVSATPSQHRAMPERS